jgi:lysyl-tRNA synthetase class 2
MLYSPHDFLPAASWPNLRLRAGLLRRLREFFHDRGFLEVETPVLSVDTVVDRHLDPFSLNVGRSGGKPQTFWLQTSPEFAMKRLLAAGAEAIYQVSRVFRQEEQGPLHNPEFTLVEWYRRGDDFRAGMQLTSDLCESLLGRGPAELLSYAEAFQRYVGFDPHVTDLDTLIAAARQCDASPPESMAQDDRDGWLDWLVTECVQGHLGVERPVLLYDFPASQAALAQIRPGEPPLAERFELYLSGWELANGYHELLDAGELRRRNARANLLRRGDGKAALPEESRLLAAMERGLPPAVGCALGFDRLVMLAAGAKSIDEVIAFPWDRA